MHSLIDTHRLWATSLRRGAILLPALVSLLVGGGKAEACPFCQAESQTLSEETQAADAVVLAKLVKEAAPVNETDGGFGAADPNTGMAKFQIVEVLRGPEALAPGQEIDVVFFGAPDREQVFLVSGIGTDKIDWTTPLRLSADAVEYVRQLSSAPASGADRLAFFQDFLEHPDPLLAQDAYDEFARAPYAPVHELGPRMRHDRLVEWIADPEVSPSRRRLYLTMLGVCGDEHDLPLLESLIVSDFAVMEPYLEQLARCGLSIGGPLSAPLWIEMVEQDERRKKLGLDALVACYLTLRGPAGLDLIDERFLKNPRVDYTYIYSTIMALRFHGEEQTSAIPRERLLASMRLLLDNPDFADQVILDLSRWQDWSVLDRLVEMFKKSDKTGYVRQPIVGYLTEASAQAGDVGDRAKLALEELERLDPEGVKQARSFMAFGALGRARAASGAAEATSVEKNVAEAAAAVPGEIPAAEAASPAADAAQGFAASAADAEGTDPSDIPDPANYVEGEPAAADLADEPPAAEEPAAAEVTVATSAEQRPTEGSAAQSPAAEAAAPQPVAAAEATAPAQNRLLVIGLPLASAVALMGVFWLILRTGAM